MSSQRSFEKDHSAKSSGAEVGNRDCREISVTCHSTDAGWCPLKSTRSINLASHGRRAGSEWRCEEEKSSEWFAECLMFGEFPVSWYRAFRPVFSTQRIHCLADSLFRHRGEIVAVWLVGWISDRTCTAELSIIEPRAVIWWSDGLLRCSVVD